MVEINMSRQKDTLLIFFVLILLCFSIYSNSLHNAFVSDDIEAILDNPHISQPLYYWLQPNNFLNSLGYLIQGYNPFIQHLINIILHCINTILVFFFLHLFFKTDASLLGACIFATHPVHTEAVAWISGRYYLIIALFVITIYLLYSHATNSTNKRTKVFYLLSLSIFSYFIVNNIGFFSLTPFLLILSDITFNRWRKNWKFWIPFLIILIVRLILAKENILFRISYMANATGQEFSWKNLVVYPPVVLFSHLSLLLWPIKLTLYHEPLQFSFLKFVLSSISLFILMFSLPFIFKKYKQLFFGICLFILFFVPVYSPVMVSSFMVAERYLYFPAISLCIFLAFLYSKYTEKSHRAKIIVRSLFILLISFYSLRTLIRNEDWRIPEKFWQATMAVSYNSSTVRNEMGRIYYQKGNIKEAIRSFEQAIRLKPNCAEAYYNLGIIYGSIGDIGQEIAFYKKAIEISPGLVQVYNNLGAAYKNQGDIEKAIALYKKAIEISPDYAGAYYNLALAYLSNGQKELAEQYYNKAKELGF